MEIVEESMKQTAIARRNIVITGATGAIGKATAIELIRCPNINLILLGRNTIGLNQLKSDLLKINSENTVDIINTDLSQLKSVGETIDLIIKKYSTLFCFVNLAAVIKKKKSYTSDNIETMFATNYVSPFLLATRLADSYSNSLKIVFVTSASATKIKLDNLQGEIKYSAISNFSQSKICNVLFIKKLSRQFESTHVTAIGFDPGIVKSKSMGELPKIFQIIGRVIGKTADRSAKSLAKIVIDNNFINGNFYDKNLKEINTSKYSNDILIQDKLFDQTNELIKTKIIDQN